MWENEFLDFTRKTFDEFQNEAEEIEADRTDHLVKDVSKNLWVANDIDFCFQQRGDLGPSVTYLHPTDWAMRQLAAKLDIPSGYPEKCIEKGHPELAAINFNTWLQEKKGNKRSPSTDYILRQYKDEIDAVFSKYYTAFDSPYILEVVRFVLNDYELYGHYLSSSRMYFGMRGENPLRIDGEIYVPVLFVSSSDVGRAALKVRLGLFDTEHKSNIFLPKIGGLLYKQTHIGVTAAEFEDELTRAMISVPSALEKAENMIRNNKNVLLDVSRDDVWNHLMRAVMAAAQVKTEKEAEEIVSLAEWKYGLSKWGIARQLADRAAEYSLEDRITLETEAGSFLLNTI